jgi:precorrin-2 dehydrogenase/sirohydrochlorin ferrochelatase
MKTYPIFAVIEDLPCMVVGGGPVGERKVRDLLEAGAQVTIVSRELTPGLAELVHQGKIHYLKDAFRPEYLEGMVLVIGATDDREVNVKVSAAARARNIWVNIVDAPELCTFIVPAQVRRGALTIAISTGGTSPALARRLREDLEVQFGPEYGPYLDLLGAVRKKILETRRGHPDNAALFHRLATAPLRSAIVQGDRVEVLRLLTEVLGTSLSPETLQELVDETLGEPPWLLVAD